MTQGDFLLPQRRRGADAQRRWLASAVVCLAVVLCVLKGVEAGEIVGRVVDANGAALSDAVVFVQELPGGVAPAPMQRTAVMDQLHKQFVPHVLPIAVGTEVLFPNHDQIHHHVYSFSRTKTFEIPLYKGETAPPVLFDKVGAVKVGCNIHDWMSGVILVLPSSYFATTNDAGGFVLHDLPGGIYPIAVWHERSTRSVADTVQRLELRDRLTDVTFTIPVVAPLARPAVRGARGYE